MISISDRVLYEDNHLLIVNKLSGELVQGDITGDEPLLEKVKSYLKEKYNKPGEAYAGLIHRLDRPTSGVVVFAKTSKALSRMNAIFEKREVIKKYYAIVAGTPKIKEEELKNHLKKNQQKNKSFVVARHVNGAKEARLRYRLKATSERYSLLEVELFTGRHHQIRVQLAERSMPIKGDLKYGFPRSNPDASISLHSGFVSFIHPVSNEKIEVKALHPQPDALWKHFNSFL